MGFLYIALTKLWKIKLDFLRAGYDAKKKFIRDFSTSSVLLTKNNGSDTNSDLNNLSSDSYLSKQNKNKERAYEGWDGDNGEGSSSGQKRKTNEKLRDETVIKRIIEQDKE